MPDQTTDPKDATKDAPKDDAAKDAPKDTPKADETPKADDVDFDGPYDEERAKKLIVNLRAQDRAKAEKLAEYEAAQETARQAELTEAQKHAEEAKKAVERAEAAERKLLVAEVATEHSVPADLLTGTTKAELEKSAKALVEFRGEAPKNDGRKPPATKPRTQLTPATGDDNSPPANDPKAIAARLRHRRR